MSCLNIHSSCRQYYKYLNTDGICFPKTNLLQVNKFIVDGVWQDELGKHDGVARQGRVYNFNGTDNSLDTGVKIQGGTPIDIDVNMDYARQFILKSNSVTVPRYSYTVLIKDNKKVLLTKNSSDKTLETGFTRNLKIIASVGSDDVNKEDEVEDMNNGWYKVFQ